MTDDEKNTIKNFWGIDTLEGLVDKCEEMISKKSKKHKSADDYINAQLFSYAHGILVMREIICLLENGFPNGAMARARRIYEQMIILTYLDEHKNDVTFDEIIKRYFDDQYIRSHSGQIEYFEMLNQRVSTKNESQNINDKILELKNGRNKIIERHAKEGLKEKDILICNYWWTGKRTSFNEIAKCFDDPFTKILYKRACTSIHASAIGDFAVLGVHNPDGNNIFSGRTANGFSAPLLLALVSFFNLTAIVFKNFDIDGSVLGKTIDKLKKSYIERIYL